MIMLALGIHMFQSKRQLLVQRRGAILSLTTVTKDAGGDMPTSMSYLWQMISKPMTVVEEDKKQGITFCASLASRKAYF